MSMTTLTHTHLLKSAGNHILAFGWRVNLHINIIPNCAKQCTIYHMSVSYIPCAQLVLQYIPSSSHESSVDVVTSI